MSERDGIGQHQESLRSLPSHGVERLRQIVGPPHVEELEADLERRGRRLGGGADLPVERVLRVPEHRDARGGRHRLLQELEALAAQLGVEQRDAGDVPARARQAGDDPRPDRIAGGGEDDRDGLGRVLRGHPRSGWRPRRGRPAGGRPARRPARAAGRAARPRYGSRSGGSCPRRSPARPAAAPGRAAWRRRARHGAGEHGDPPDLGRAPGSASAGGEGTDRAGRDATDRGRARSRAASGASAVTSGRPGPSGGSRRAG